MKLTTLLFALLVLASAAAAQEMPKPDAPKPNGKVFWTGVSLLAASKTSDAITTRIALDNGAREKDPIFGPHPSAPKQAAINALFFAGETAFFYATEHNRHAWVRWTGRAYVGLIVVNHVQLAVCNSRTAHNCHSIPAVVF